MSQIKVYRLLHKPTGLFYQTAKGYSWDKTNLSKNGKLYHVKPSYKHINHGYHLSGEFHKTKIEEWDILEYEVTLVKQYGAQ